MFQTVLIENIYCCNLYIVTHVVYMFKILFLFLLRPRSDHTDRLWSVMIFKTICVNVFFFFGRNNVDRNAVLDIFYFSYAFHACSTHTEIPVLTVLFSAWRICRLTTLRVLVVKRTDQRRRPPQMPPVFRSLSARRLALTTAP